MKILVSLVLLFLPTVILAQINDDSISCNSKNPYFVVDTMPRFQGDGIEKFKGYVVQNLHASPIAVKSRKRGEISIQFVICKTGTLVDPKIISGLKSDIDNELIRILSNSPSWDPGWHEGRLVNVVYTVRIPVNFRQIK
jgi:hypothetical protein